MHDPILEKYKFICDELLKLEVEAKKLKQQSIMSAFAIDTALMSDERLAKSMRAVKAAKRKTNSKADVTA